MESSPDNNTHPKNMFAHPDYPQIGAVIDAYGTERWYYDGKLHRDGDLPAILRSNGDLEWYQFGVMHRDGDRPAIVRANGDQEWYQYGQRHRGAGDDGETLPAVVRADGTLIWYKYGCRHREGGLPAFVDAYGYQEWWMDGEECGEPQAEQVSGPKAET